MGKRPEVRAASAAVSAVGLGGVAEKAKAVGAKLGVEALNKTGVGRVATSVVDAGTKIKDSLFPGKASSSGPKPAGRKVAIPLASFVMVVLLLGGGMFALQGSGGAAALMGVEGTSYAREHVGEEQVNGSLRMTEFYSWSAGEPSVPWELVGGIEGVVSAYGNHVNAYPNEPATRTAQSGSSASATSSSMPALPPGAQAYPVVYPPITGNAGVGPFLLNPKHLEENEASARDVYENCTLLRKAYAVAPQEGEFPDVAAGESAVVVKAHGTTSTTVSPYAWLRNKPKSCDNGVVNTGGGGSNFDPAGPVTPTTRAASGRASAVYLDAQPIAYVEASQAGPPTTRSNGEVELPPVTLPGGLLPPISVPPVTIPPISLPPPLGPGPAGGATTTTVFVPETVPPGGGGGVDVNRPDKVLPPHSPANYPLIDPQDARASALYVMHQLKTRALQVFACFGKPGQKEANPPKDVSEEELLCWDYDPGLTERALGWKVQDPTASTTTTIAAVTTTKPGDPPPPSPIRSIDDLHELRLTGKAIDFWKALLVDIISCGQPNRDSLVVVIPACGPNIANQIVMEAWRLADEEAYPSLLAKACALTAGGTSTGGGAPPGGTTGTGDPMVPGGAATGEFTRLDWARDLVSRMRARDSFEVLSFVVAWERAEGGHFVASSMYNPLNTTMDAEGAVVINSHGVKSYPDYETGMDATLRTIYLSYYTGVVAGMEAGDGQGALTALIESPWGTGALAQQIYDDLIADPNWMSDPAVGGGTSGTAPTGNGEGTTTSTVPASDGATPTVAGGATTTTTPRPASTPIAGKATRTQEECIRTVGGLPPTSRPTSNPGPSGGGNGDPPSPWTGGTCPGRGEDGRTERPESEIVWVHNIQVHQCIVDQLNAAYDAAQGDGVTLVGTGWRSMDEQIALRRQNCGTSEYAIYEMPSTECSPNTARPGYSNHQGGVAIDMDGPSRRWMFDNRDSGGGTYGFYNYPPEEWHWSIDGR